MANKKAKPNKLSPKSRRAIFNQITKDEWLQIVNAAHPNGRWQLQGNLVSGRCPFHQDTDPSFRIDLQKGFAKCFGADCNKFFYDPVELYKALHGDKDDYHRTLTILKDRFNINISRTDIAKVGKLQKHRRLKEILFNITHGELVDCAGVMKTPDSHPELQYARDAVLYLADRGITDYYHHLPIGVMPPFIRVEALITDHLALTGDAKETAAIIDGAKKYLDWATGPEWIGSLIFFTGASPNDIARLKLRRVPQASWPAWQKDQFQKDMRYVNDDFDKGPGIFGLYGVPPYQVMMGKPMSFVYVEGEFDALAIIAKQFEPQGVVNRHVFAGGGGATDGVDVMKEFGYTQVDIVGDYDEGGLKFVKKVLENTEQLGARVFKWPPELIVDAQGKLCEETDPAEQVMFHGLDVVQRALCTNNNFLHPHDWALEHAAKEMHGVDENDVRQLSSIASRWGHYIHSESEIQTYITEIAKQFKIVESQIRNEIQSQGEDENAFIERIRSVLAGRVQPMQIVQQNCSHILRVWDKISLDIYDMYIGEKQRIKSTLEAMMRKDILQFVVEDVGMPPFLDVDEESKSNYITVANRCLDYTVCAITRLPATLPPNCAVRPLGAGLHCVAPSLEHPEETLRLYLVNGTTLYKGDFDNGQLLWKQMPGPCDGSIVVYAEGNNRPRKFLPFVETVSDLNQTPEFTIQQLWDYVYGMVDAGWDFKNHNITCELLTAAILSIPISNCVPRRPLFMLSAEQSSGKSSMIGGLIGKTNMPAINIVYPSLYMDDYTVAGVRQSMNHSSLCICLDEFEDKGGNDRKSNAVRGILQMLRGHSNEEGLIVIGSTTGQHREYNLPCMVFVAGIRNLDDPADISRFIQIEMRKQPYRASPRDIILQKYGESLIQRIRKSIPLTMFRHAKEFRQAYYDIIKEFSGGKGLEQLGQLTRSREHLYPMMAIMKVAGRDYKKFIRTYLKQHRSNLESIARMSCNESILDQIFYTNAIRIPGDDDTRAKSVSELLMQDSPALLNSAHQGLFYDAKRQWLVVHWPTVKNNVLVNSREHQDRSAHWLQTQAARNPYYINELEAIRDGVYKRLRPYLGPGMIPKKCSVFDVKTLMKDSDTTLGEQILPKGIENFEFSNWHKKMQERGIRWKSVPFRSGTTPDVYTIDNSSLDAE